MAQGNGFGAAIVRRQLITTRKRLPVREKGAWAMKTHLLAQNCIYARSRLPGRLLPESKANSACPCLMLRALGVMGDQDANRFRESNGKGG